MLQTSRDAAASRRHYAPMFTAMGDETRLAIIGTLADGQRCSIARLTKGTRLTRQAVAKHLRVLEKAKLVRSRRAGRESLYELDAQSIRELRDYAEMISEHWDRALLRLKAFVEE